MTPIWNTRVSPKDLEQDGTNHFLYQSTLSFFLLNLICILSSNRSATPLFFKIESCTLQPFFNRDLYRWSPSFLQGRQLQIATPVQLKIDFFKVTDFFLKIFLKVDLLLKSTLKIDFFLKPITKISIYVSDLKINFYIWKLISTSLNRFISKYQFLFWKSISTSVNRLLHR